MKCPGLHCDGCGGGGIGAGAVVMIVVLALIATHTRTAEHAAADVLNILFITAATVAGLALVAGTVAAVVMLRRRSARRALAASGQRADMPVLIRTLGSRQLPGGRGWAGLALGAPAHDRTPESLHDAVSVRQARHRNGGAR